MYTYDFGDEWTHSITLEKITGNDAMIADCIGGKGKCPPEDCGGHFGYMDLKEILNNPENPESKDMREWLGMSKKAKWEADDFDLKQTSNWLRKFCNEYL